MSISISCLCEQVFQVVDEMAGRKIRCPGCGMLQNAPGKPGLALVPPYGEGRWRRPTEISFTGASNAYFSPPPADLPSSPRKETGTRRSGSSTNPSVRHAPLPPLARIGTLLSMLESLLLAGVFLWATFFVGASVRPGNGSIERGQLIVALAIGVGVVCCGRIVSGVGLLRRHRWGRVGLVLFTTMLITLLGVVVFILGYGFPLLVSIVWGAGLIALLLREEVGMATLR